MITEVDLREEAEFGFAPCLDAESARAWSCDHHVMMDYSSVAMVIFANTRPIAHDSQNVDSSVDESITQALVYSRL